MRILSNQYNITNRNLIKLVLHILEPQLYNSIYFIMLLHLCFIYYLHLQFVLSSIHLFIVLIS
jgi:hypothetical protein